jgi:tetratricopeptide (TPR) repeat protein
MAPRIELPWRKRLLFAAAAFVLFFGGLELALRAVGAREEEEDPFVGFSSTIPLYVERDGWMETNPAKALLFNPQRFPREKPEGSVRIFSLGGSTTYGHPYDDIVSFSGWLRELLNETDSAASYEVINAGGVSYASYRVAALMEELLAYEPDVFVVYTGHNEFLERRTYGSLLDAPSWALSAGGLLNRTAIFRTGAQLVRGKPVKNVLPAEVDTVLDNSAGPERYRRDDKLAEAVAYHFERNLERMAGLARSAGARLILVTPAASLRDCRPFKSEGPEERDASAWYDKAEAFYAQGEYAQAREAYLRAMDEDVCPLRATTPIREAVRRVAEREGVPLVDFEAMLERRSEHGVPGADWFVDHVHLSIAGYRLLGLELLREMQREGLAGGAAPTEAQLATVDERVHTRMDERAYGISFRNLARVLSWAGKDAEAGPNAARAIELMGPDAESYELLGRARQAQGALDSAEQAFRDSIAADPERANGYARLGALLLERRQSAAASVYLAEAARLGAERAEVYNNLALALMAAGKTEDAVPHLEHATKLEPDAAKVWANRGLAELKTNRLDAAENSLSQAIALAPDSVEAWTNIGLVYAQTGRWVEAEEALRAAGDLQPDSAAAKFNIAVAVQQQGRTAEARALYEEVLRADPGHAGARQNLSLLTP